METFFFSRYNNDEKHLQKQLRLNFKLPQPGAPRALFSPRHTGEKVAARPGASQRAGCFFNQGFLEGSNVFFPPQKSTLMSQAVLTDRAKAKKVGR